LQYFLKCWTTFFSFLGFFQQFSELSTFFANNLQNVATILKHWKKLKKMQSSLSRRAPGPREAGHGGARPPPGGGGAHG
jgi:hypothetical protein